MRAMYNLLNDLLNIVKDCKILTFEKVFISYERTICDTSGGKREEYKIERRID